MDRMVLVRAGPKGVLVDEFIRRGVVLVAWQDLGDLSSISSRDELEKLIIRTYANSTRASDGQLRAKLARILEVIPDSQPGEWVATLHPGKRIMCVGKVAGSYEYLSEARLFAGGELYRHSVPVDWLFGVHRDNLELSTRHDLDDGMMVVKVLSQETIDDVLNAPRTPIPHPSPR